MLFPRSRLYPLVGLFTMGGVFSFYINCETTPLWIGLTVLILMYFFIKKRANRLNTSLLYFSFLIMGLLHFKEYYRLPKAHFQNHSAPNSEVFKKIEIVKPLGVNSFSFSFIGELKQWGDDSVMGKILVYQTRDSLTLPFQRGQVILTKTNCYSIKSNPNPGGFLYKDYLKNIRVYQQIQIDGKTILHPIKKITPWFFNVLKIKENVEIKIEQSTISKDSKGMLMALLLGKRNAIDDEILSAYTKAGVIHLLALSGLHVGLFVLLIMFLLKPITSLKYGKTVRFIIVLIFLWGFAFFVGLSPSVVRAVTLFTFVVIGSYINQGKHSFHYTVLSFFILIIAYPPFLRAIGFQLSYLAVFGILGIYPLLKKLWNPSNWFLKKIWNLAAISIAAQIAVSPISIYYFHQFPSLFLLSNIIILPFFGAFLSLSLIILFAILLNFSNPLLFQFYDIGVDCLNKIINWVAQQEAFLFENIYYSASSTFLLYCIIILAVLFFYKKTFLKGTWVLLFILVFISNLILEAKKENEINSFWVFHKHNESLMGHQKGGILYYHTSDEENTNRLLWDFTNSRKLKENRRLLLKNMYVQKNFKLLLLENKQLTGIKEIAPTHILLQKNVKLNLELLFEEYKPDLLIADGSNAPWSSYRWEKTCKKYKVPFYDTRKKGGLKINLGNEE